MDRLRSLGTVIFNIIPSTSEVYAPLLLANASAIRSTRRETFRYGPTERHELDVYHPSTSTSTTSPSPILIFFHGGGFVNGGKTMPASPAPDAPPFADGLVYANLGHFFAAKHGFTTIVANYRLHRHEARFPSGGEDFALAIRWARENLAKPSAAGATNRDLHLIGNSAGGTHLATFLFHPDFAALRAELRGPVDSSTGASTGASSSGLTLRSATLLSHPFDFPEILPRRAEVINTYFRGDVVNNVPRALVERMQEKNEELAPGVRLMIVDCELDPEDEIVSSTRRAVEIIGKTRKVDVLRIPGHNHLSPVLALGTGSRRDEAWGDVLAGWMLL